MQHEFKELKTDMNAADILDSAAQTYRERNKIYGDNYKHFGFAAAALFPDGLLVTSAAEWNRLGIFVQCLSKLSRAAGNLHVGGHLDSAHDLSVYAAMLQELTEEGTAPARTAYKEGAREVLEALRRQHQIGALDSRETADDIANRIAAQLGIE